MTSLRALCSKGILRVVTPALHKRLRAKPETLVVVGTCQLAQGASWDTNGTLLLDGQEPRALLEHICWNAVGPASATACRTGMRCHMTERAEQLREVAVPSKFRGETAVRVSRQESDIDGTSPPKR
ncbi:hypothetical protein EDB89DRAFT_1907777 [Lactarius sanguifluus]|nr:hypothetical protein EDB89DRAFT_1907777 [Lactarius sanguifluus]